MPVGVQIMGQQNEDARITAMARWLLKEVPPIMVA
jgi:Asp-tRNA(Asn)/Glu-tRNA(Gln) amidotransferase A subunit family amidase